MADQLRLCPECGQYVHVSKMHVGWRGCYDCEAKRRGILEAVGIWTPDMEYAAAERKIWTDAKKRGVKIERLID